MKVHVWLWCGNMEERGYFEDIVLHGRIIIIIIIIQIINKQRA